MTVWSLINQCQTCKDALRQIILLYYNDYPHDRIKYNLIGSINQGNSSDKGLVDCVTSIVFFKDMSINRIRNKFEKPFASKDKILLIFQADGCGERR
jgi:hypothetical protein